MVKSTISKEELAKLPREVFGGTIKIITDELDAASACDELQRQEVIGFDTETRPAFKKGVSHKVALMQLATKDTCYLFRLNKIGMPDTLASIITNPKIKKIGLALRDDFSAIRKRESMQPQNFIDLQPFVSKYGIEDNSLQRIHAILFNKRISKRQQLSNWENEELTEAQQMYAAIDAWSCLMIYNKTITLPLVDK